MSEFFDDPKYPGRPKHPDFWLLVKAVNKVDAYASEDNLSLEEILGEKVEVNPDALIYLAQQRVMRTRHLVSAAVISLYLDAFAAGVMYEREKS